MFKRQTSGSVLCSSCGKLVGVRDDVCWNCGRRNPGLWGFASSLRRLGYDLGFVPIVIGACGILYVLSLVLTLAFDPRGISTGGPMSFLGARESILALLGASGATPVFVWDHWWTLLSAGWLHGSLLHIFFNMLWVRQLAPAVAELYGAPRAVIIYVISSALGFFCSSVAGLASGPSGAPITLGASAAIFGLLGALVVYGRRGGSSHISGQAISFAVIMFLLGLMMPGVDNYAHAGGFLGGYGIARWLDPLQPEKIAHLVTAVALLALSGIAVLLSVFSGLSF